MNIMANVAQQAGRKFPWIGVEFSFPLGPENSSGLVDAVVPSGEGPPIHVHSREDEIFYLLEGTYEFYLDGETFTRAAGEAVFLPRNVPHTFRVVSKTPGRNLTIITPGGFEKFFIECSERALTIPQHMAEVKELAAGYGLRFVGPPLSARG